MFKKNIESEKGQKLPDKGQKQPNKQNKGLSKRTIWTLKITITTFCLSGFFSFITEITSSSSNIIIACLILLLLISINIVFDGIGVAATSCSLPPLLAMSARKVPGAAVAVKLVKNAEKVSNICADVIGDICGIISGACTIAIVLKLPMSNQSIWVNILFSAAVAALTVGGKAFNKSLAIKNSKEVIMLASRIIGIVYKPDRKKNKKNKAEKPTLKDKKSVKVEQFKTEDKSVKVGQSFLENKSTAPLEEKNILNNNNILNEPHED